MEKKNIKVIVKIICFVLVTAVLFEVLSLTAFSKEAGGTAYRNKKNKLYSFYLEPDESIQLSGIGNSDLYSGFAPTVLWQEQGITSQMMSTPYQTPLQSYYYLKDIFKYQTPEVVMIEVDMLFDYSTHDEPDYEENALDSFFNYLNTDDFETVIFDKLTIFTFHDRWKKYKKESHKLRTPNSHGYKYFTAVEKMRRRKYMIKTDEREPVNKNKVHQLEMMLDLCKEEGAKVFFLEMPTLSSWDYKRHNTVCDLAEKYGVDFLDTNVHIRDMGLDMSVSFRDKGNHLNYEGAKVLTKYVGEYIKDNFDLDDRRLDAKYDYWNDSVKEFEKEMKREDKIFADNQEEE